MAQCSGEPLPANRAATPTSVAWPLAEFERLRADVAGNFLWKLNQAGDLGERVRSGKSGRAVPWRPRARVTRLEPSSGDHRGQRDQSATRPN